MVFFSIFQYDERDFKNNFVYICSVHRWWWLYQQGYKESKKVKKRLDLYSKSLVYLRVTKGEKTMKSKFPSVGSVVFFNGFMNTVVGTHGLWVKIKDLKGKTQWVDSNLIVMD